MMPIERPGQGVGQPIPGGIIDIPPVPVPNGDSGQFILGPTGKRLLDAEGRFLVHDATAEPCCQQPGVPCQYCSPSATPRQYLLSVTSSLLCPCIRNTDQYDPYIAESITDHTIGETLVLTQGEDNPCIYRGDKDVDPYVYRKFYNYWPTCHNHPGVELTADRLYAAMIIGQTQITITAYIYASEGSSLIIAFSSDMQPYIRPSSWHCGDSFGPYEYTPSLPCYGSNSADHERTSTVSLVAL